MKPGGLWLDMEPANLLKIDTLDKSWRDADYVMLHACFQILVDFVEKEKAFECHKGWDQDQMHVVAKTELLELYDWWNTYKDEESKSEIPDWESHMKENEMLKRLIDIRWAMWT